MSENWSSEAVERARRRTSPEDWATYERVEGWNAFTRQAMMGKSWLTDRVRYDVAVCIFGLPLYVLMWVLMVVYVERISELALGVTVVTFFYTLYFIYKSARIMHWNSKAKRAALEAGYGRRPKLRERETRDKVRRDIERAQGELYLAAGYSDEQGDEGRLARRTAREANAKNPTICPHCGSHRTQVMGRTRKGSLGGALVGDAVGGFPGAVAGSYAWGKNQTEFICRKCGRRWTVS